LARNRQPLLTARLYRQPSVPEISTCCADADARSSRSEGRGVRGHINRGGSHIDEEGIAADHVR
jgi:hypothetical protein